MLGEGSTVGAFFRKVLFAKNGCGQDENAVSRTICAASGPTTRKRRESVYGREEAL